MKIIRLSTFTAFYLLGLAGCANTETVLKNDKGETRYCYLSHSAASGAALAASGEYSRCLNDAGTAGFRRVN